MQISGDILRNDGLFLNCKNLENLHWIQYGAASGSQNAVKSILTTSKTNLKVLTCSGDSLYTNNLLSKVGLKLTEFSISPRKKGLELVRNFQLNLNSFLMTQRNTLRSIKISVFANTELFRTLLSMPLLEKVVLPGLRAIDRNEYAVGRFSQNLSVTNLHLPLVKNGNFYVYTLLFELFPNIESLKLLGQLNNDSANMISKRCKYLKQLSVEWFNVTNISKQAFYLGLSKIECCYMTREAAQLSEKLKVQMIGESFFREL